MIPASGASVAAPLQKIVLPLVCAAAWAVAAAGARLLGIWTAVGATAIALGITVLLLDGAAARKLLGPRPRLVLLGAGAGATMAAATYLLYPLFSAIAPFVARDTALLYSAFRAPSLAAVVLDGAAARKLLGPRPRLVLLGAGVGATMAAATYLLYPLFSAVAPFVARDTALLYSAFRAPSLAAVVLAFLPVIFGEELVWRGVVQTSFAQRFGRYGGAILAASAYALAHAPLGSPVLVLAALACGLCWSALRAATGSLVPALVAHIVWDAVILLWLPLIPA